MMPLQPAIRRSPVFVLAPPVQPAITRSPFFCFAACRFSGKFSPDLCDKNINSFFIFQIFLNLFYFLFTYLKFLNLLIIALCNYILTLKTKIRRIWRFCGGDNWHYAR